jgi:hypothetical protein
MLGNTRLRSARAPSGLRLAFSRAAAARRPARNGTMNEITYISRHGLVHGTPPDVLFRRVLLYDSLIRGRTSGLGSRVRRERTGRCDGRA